jgi:hypothetical protein
MAINQQIPWYQQGFANWQPKNINLTPLGGYGMGFQGFGAIPQPDILSKGFLPSSETAMQASPLNPATNAAQNGQSGADSLVKAQELIASMFAESGSAINTGGIPIPGSEDIKRKVSASGVRYNVVDIRPRDEMGQLQGPSDGGRMTFGITPEKKAEMSKQYASVPHSWEKKEI